jgi:hypothetical protein
MIHEVITPTQIWKKSQIVFIISCDAFFLHNHIPLYYKENVYTEHMTGKLD